MLVALALLTGCVSATDVPRTDGAVSDDRRTASAIDASAPTTETVLITDPVENAFTVEVPAGWDSVAYLSSEGSVRHQVVTSVSPDGRTVLFVGDPKMPNYWDPDRANDITRQFAGWLDLMQLQYYYPADMYFPDYTIEKFGALPDFEMLRTTDAPELVRQVQQEFANAGLGTPEAHAVRVRFSYSTDDGTPMQGLIVGVTINGGDFWQASVQGLATDRTVEEYETMLAAMAGSQRTNPEFTARLQAEHEATMAGIQAEIQAMTARHEANMAWIQQSAQRHQQRMNAIWAQGDASMQNYYARMDSMDNTQQSFLNYINEENTVAPIGGGTGTTWQVDSGYDRYWMNPDTGGYVGGDINFGESQLRELGLNPGDYEEVTVIR